MTERSDIHKYSIVNIQSSISLYPGSAFVKYRANRIWGNAKSQSGKVEMANIDWVWRLKISGTDDPSLRRLDVEVFIEGEDAVKARLTGFIARI